MNATQCIKKHLESHKSPGSSWWQGEHFKPGVALPSGCENFSPAASPQGHRVYGVLSLFPVLIPRYGILVEFREADYLTVIVDSRCTIMAREDLTC